MATAAVIRFWRRILRGTTVVALLALFSLAGMAWAQSTNTIYRDSFNRKGPLNGSTPSLAGAGNANVSWIAYPGLTTDGAAISVTMATPPPAGGMSQYNNAFLPFTPAVGHVYTLSVDIKGEFGDGNWQAFGFAQNALWHEYFAAADIGAGWLLQRANNSAVQIFQGPGTSGDASFSSTGNTNVFNHYSIVLDTTTGDMFSGWTITFFQDGSELQQDVYESNPAIACVGVGADGSTGHYRNFNLSDFVPAGFTNRAVSEYRNVASAREPGVRIAVSSHSFLNGGMLGDQSTCPLNRPAVPGDPVAHVWLSSEYEHLPQWVWVQFPGPRRIDRMVVCAASKETSPVEFSGQYLPPGSEKFVTLFHTGEAKFDARALSCTVRFEPVVASNFRLLIERSAASVTPQSWVTELSQIQVFGVDATNQVATSVSVSSDSPPVDLDSSLQPTTFVPRVKDRGPTLDIRTPWYRLVLDKSNPRILNLCWDSLGQSELGVNFLQDSGACPVLDPVFEKSTPLGTGALTRTGNVFRYAPVQVASNAWEQVCIRTEERGFDLGLAAAADQTTLLRGGLFRFHFAANQTPTTFVGRPSKIMNFVETPTYLATPDFGTAYVTRTGDPAAFYRKPSALFPATTYWVDITPGEPASEDGLNEIGPKPWRTTLHFQVQQIEPLASLVKRDSRLVNQALIPPSRGKPPVVVHELFVTKGVEAAYSTLRDGHWVQLQILQMADPRMRHWDRELAKLVRNGRLPRDIAQAHARDTVSFMKFLS